MLQLESPDIIESRNSKKSATRKIRSIYDSELSDIAKAGKKKAISPKAANKPEEKPKIRSRVQTPPTPPSQSTRMPEPDQPRMTYSKPDPDPFPIKIDIEGPFEYLKRKIIDFLFGKIEDYSPKPKTKNKETHIYV